VLQFWNPWKAIEKKTETQMSPAKLADKSNEENVTCPVATEGKKSL
jgi:hypothetical protein